MTTFYWILAAILLLLLLAAGAQHTRYLQTRRTIAMDRQPMLHSSEALHVVTVVARAPEQDLLSGLSDFVRASEAAGGLVVYVGRIVVNGLVSKQIPQHDWNAFVLTQFPSRAAYEDASARSDYQKARAGFGASYALGLSRSPWVNLAIPIGLLGLRTVDLLKGQPARYPFERAPVEEVEARLPIDGRETRAGLMEGLLAHREEGRDAVVVLNFLKGGTPEEQAADARYGRRMFSMMAETGNGPLHIGRAVTLEGDADFDRVAIVYYPGVDYFVEMVQSTFFTRIAGDKQLGDSLAAPSVPLLPQLQTALR